jgi:hypothetical protein
MKWPSARLLGVTALLLLIVLGALFLSLQKTRLPDPEENADNRPSVYNAFPEGYLTYYKVLQQVAPGLSTWRKPIDTLPNQTIQPHTLLVVAPMERHSLSNGKSLAAFDEAQIARLLAWVRQGNRLVLLGDFDSEAQSGLLAVLGLKAEGDAQKDGRRDEQGLEVLRLSESAPAVYTRFILQPVRTGHGVRLASLSPADRESRLRLFLKNADIKLKADKTAENQKPPSARALLASVQQAPPLRPVLVDHRFRWRVVEARLDSGTVVVGTTPDLGANKFLHDQGSDNFQLLSNLLRAGKGPAILVDEFVHGYSELADNLIGFYAQTPLKALVGQLILLAVAWCLLGLFGRPARLSLANPTQDDAELPPDVSRFARSVAQLYRNQQLSSFVLNARTRHLWRALRKRHGLDRAASRKALMTAFSWRGVEYSKIEESVAALEAATDAATQSKRLSSADTLVLSQKISWLQENLSRDSLSHH